MLVHVNGEGNGPGVDFVTRDGTVRVKVRADSLSATELDLEPDAQQVFEPIVPISAVILGGDGAFTLDLVKSITITTSDDRVESVGLLQDGQGMWLSIYPQLQRIAPSWGWTAEQLDQLQTDLTAASRKSTSGTYSVTLPQVEHKGALTSAEVTIDSDDGNVGLAFTIDRPPEAIDRSPRRYPGAFGDPSARQIQSRKRIEQLVRET